MAMNDDSMVKIMESLDLNFNPAEMAIKSFSGRVSTLNKQLFDLKANMAAGLNKSSQLLSSQIGNIGVGGNTSLGLYDFQLKSIQQEAQRAATSIKQVASQVNNSNITNNPNNIFAQGFQRRAEWFLTGSLFFGVTNGAVDAVKSIAEVETAINTISRVMQDATLDTKGFRDQLLQIGVDMGQSFDNVQKVATTWATAGYNAKDSIELTKTSLLAMNTAEMDATQATTGLVAIMSQWGLTSKELLPVLDKINKVADTQVITSGDLINGLAKSSATAKNFGLTLNDTIAYLSIMKDTTGATGKELGNAFKSILSYTQRPGALNAFENLGIQVFADKARTQFTGVDKIFAQIAEKWPRSSKEIQDGFIKAADDAGLMNDELTQAVGMQETWNDVQKRDISQSSGGVYRRTYFQALIENLGNLQKVYDAIGKSAGYSEMEQAQRMQTLQAKYSSLQTAVKQLAVSMGDSGLLTILKGLTTGTTEAIEAFNRFPQPLKDFILATSGVFVAVKTLQAGLKLFGVTLGANAIAEKAAATATVTNAASQEAAALAAIERAVADKNAAASAIILAKTTEEAAAANIALMAAQRAEAVAAGTLAAAQEGVAVATEAATVASKGFILTNPILLGIATAFGVIATAVSLLNSNQKDLNKSVQDNINKYTQEKQAIDDLITSYKDNAELAKTNTDAKIKLWDIEAQLFTMFGESAKAIDLENGSIDKNIAKIKELGKTKLQDFIDANKLIAESNEKTLNKKSYGNPYFAFGTSDDTVKQSKDDVNTLQQYIDKLRTLRKQLVDGSILVPYDFDSKKAVDSINAEIKKMQEKYEDLQNTISQVATAEKQLEGTNKKTEGGAGSETTITNIYNPDTLQSLLNADKIGISEYVSQLKKIRDTQYKDLLSKSPSELNNLLVNGTDDQKTRANAYLGLLQDINSATDSLEEVTTKTNSALDTAIKLIQHRKAMGQESAAQEVADLKRIASTYRMNADERMSIDEQIYAAEKALKDQTLQFSVNWINEKKGLDQLSTEQEIAAWNRVLVNQKGNIEAVKEATVNLHNLKKQQMDDELKFSEDWISEQKNLGNLSIDDEIAAWNRVKTNQVDNIEAVKEATLNLYRLTEQKAQEAYQSAESSIEHWAKTGVYSIQQQIDKYRELYSVKTLTAEEQWKLDEQVQDKYKDLIQDRLDTLQDALDKEKAKIEKEAKDEIKIQQDKINQIDADLKKLDRDDSQKSYEDKKTDLEAQKAYWGVRTGKEAKEKLADINKQIDDLEYEHNQELKKQDLEDQKQDAQDEIDNINKNAEDKKTALDTMWADIQKIFSGNNESIITAAMTASQSTWEEWDKNFFQKMKQVIESGEYNPAVLATAKNPISTPVTVKGADDVLNNAGNLVKDATTTANNMPNAAPTSSAHDWGMSEADYQTFISNGKAWYNANVSEKKALQALNDAIRIKYGHDPALGEYPKFHTGAETLSYGAAIFKPGELVFPPELSTDLKTIIAYERAGAFKGSTTQTSTTDNRRQVNLNGPLLNIEHNYMEDEVDSDIMARQLARAVVSVK